MNPSENQNPNPQIQPPINSAPEPTQSFAPQAIFSHTPLTPEQIQQQEELEEKVLKKKKLITKLAIIIPTSLLLIGLLLVLILTDTIPLHKFKTITYDNGQGSSFSLKFYRKYSTTTTTTSSRDLINPDLSTNKNLYQLTSKITNNGKLPVVLSIWYNPYSQSWDNQFSNCSSKAPTAFTVHDSSINTDINTCTLLVSGSNDAVYVGVAKVDEQHLLIFTVAQDIDFQKIANKDTSYAKEVVGKIGLQDYQDDLKTIIGSIKPL
jgi:hypothetical protein